MQNESPILDYETCIRIGNKAEETILSNTKNVLNQRHPSTNGMTYIDNLALDISRSEGLISRCDTPGKKEVMELLHEAFRNLDELNQHCLFLSLQSENKEEEDIVNDLAWHLEEELMDRADEILAPSRIDRKPMN